MGLGQGTLPANAGELLRALRAEFGLSQLELAQCSGISLAHISRIECGQRGLTIRTARRLATALNLPITLLIELIDEEVGAQVFA